MIHVERQPEPEDFDARVRQPGKRKPTNRAALWRRCLPQLWQAYDGVCAYLCVRIPPGTGARTVEHLAPRLKRPDLAYEWSNFRLVCALMNARKRDFEDVLDPFDVRDGWFTLELSSLEVLPSPTLSVRRRRQVQATIDRLKLNDPECLAARAEHYDAYLENELTFERLARWSPFVAKELARQGLVAP